MSVLKRTKVVMLSTNQKAQISLGRITKKLTYDKVSRIQDNGQHLYFLSDSEEIKEDDKDFWFIEFNKNGKRDSYCNKPILCDVGVTNNFILTKNNGNFPFPENCKKIIATTDFLTLNKSLEDGLTAITLPQPSNSFIEKYIEKYNAGTPIIEVMVEYESHTDNMPENEDDIILPWRAYVDYRLKINSKDNCIVIRAVKDIFTRRETLEFAIKFADHCVHQIPGYEKLQSVGEMMKYEQNL
jgi:hypothetical protein